MAFEGHRTPCRADQAKVYNQRLVCAVNGLSNRIPEVSSYTWTVASAPASWMISPTGPTRRLERHRIGGIFQASHADHRACNPYNLPPFPLATLILPLPRSLHLEGDVETHHTLDHCGYSIATEALAKRLPPGMAIYGMEAFASIA